MNLMYARVCAYAGLVYRTKETSLVVAVDDVPDEGMDQPLRIDKLANEVRSIRSHEINKLTNPPPYNSILSPLEALAVSHMLRQAVPRMHSPDIPISVHPHPHR